MLQAVYVGKAMANCSSVFWINVWSRLALSLLVVSPPPSRSCGVSNRCLASRMMQITSVNVGAMAESDAICRRGESVIGKPSGWTLAARKNARPLIRRAATMPPITPRRESLGFTDNPCLAVDVRQRFLAWGAPSYAEGYMPRSMLLLVPAFDALPSPGLTQDAVSFSSLFDGVGAAWESANPGRVFTSSAGRAGLRNAAANRMEASSRRGLLAPSAFRSARIPYSRAHAPAGECKDAAAA